MRKALAGEFFGTALMVGVGCGSVALGASHGVVSMTFGLAVTCAILLFGSWSGAHINPAVTLAFWRDGQLESNKVGPYMLAQYSGAFLAAMAVQAAAPTTVQPHLHALEGFAIELVITALLMTSILLVVQRTSSRTLIAVWVGGTVALLAFLAGPLTGASMNPARTFGPNVLGGMLYSLPFYISSTTLGAWFACDLKSRFFPDKRLSSEANI